jgi:hypothetical protein
MPYVIALMALLPILDFASRWYLSRDVDCPEGGYLPDRWLCWGTCRSFSGKADFRYFLLRLPSYEWSARDDGRHYGWSQLALFMFNGKWQMIETMPLPSAEYAHGC